MSVEEATLQLELVGHDFFVFTNAETNHTNVVYRRNDGHYGLIEPARTEGGAGSPRRAGPRSAIAEARRGPCDGRVARVRQ